MKNFLARAAGYMHYAENLQAYARRPDCFQHAARAIGVQCGELEMNEGERIKGKYAYTLLLRFALTSVVLSSRDHDDPMRIANSHAFTAYGMFVVVF